MKRKPLKFLGLVLILVGAIFILNGFSGMTGFVIASNFGIGFSKIFGIALVVVGVILSTTATLEDRMVLVRHYTTNSRAKRIAEEKRLGDEQYRLDQGKVFVEKASGKKPLSAADFRKKYAITNGKKGSGYVEFNVPRGELGSKINPRTGRTEYFISGSYEIDGDVDVATRPW